VTRVFDALWQRETLHRRLGIVPGSGFATVPVMQRTTIVLRCAGDTTPADPVISAASVAA
jgi:hypothetical protein